MPIESSKTSIDSAKDSAKDPAEDPTIELSEDLSSLLCAHGIADSYIGYDGEHVNIPITHRIAILQLKGTAVVNSEGQLDDRGIRQALESLQLNQWQSVLPPVLIDWHAEPGLPGAISIPLRVPVDTLEQSFSWTLVTEQGEHWQGEFLPAQLILKSDFHQGQSNFQERWLPLAEICETVLRPGYHVFSVKPSGENPAPDLCSSLSLIIAPSRCHEPHWATNHQRLWGFSAQLYSVRSEKNWGIGDFADLDELIRLAAENGADFLILNPLHASDAASPEQCSPYSPADRRRLNPMYLDINIEPEFDACLKADVGLFDLLEPHIAQLNQTPLVDYTAVSELKYRVFSLMYTMFLQQHKKNQTSRFQAFQHYVQRSGQTLEQFTQWQATAKAPMTGTHGDSPEFYAYLQWLTENQLEQCQQLALSLGMKIGLIRDLAVGSDVNGAEVVMNPQAFCREASIGAPPDPLAPQGQNWGLPPLDPHELYKHAFTHFIDLLRTNMSHCGALRIDHVMSMMRLWWCAAVGESGQGAYVHYPVRELFALLCLESYRNNCVVIGEDLGVVPPEVRHYLSTSGIFSNVLFYFEKYDGFHFRRPEHYAEKALCMVANHDVPTLAAWWNGNDLKLRRNLNLIDDDHELHAQLMVRQSEQQQVCHWLEAQWLLPANRFNDKVGNPFDQSLAAAIMQCCARSRSQLLSIQLDDLVLEHIPVNIPGTSSEYPNWQRKLPITMWDALSAQADNPMLNAIRRERS